MPVVLSHKRTLFSALIFAGILLSVDIANFQAQYSDPVVTGADGGAGPAGQLTAPQFRS